jgi:hypothetical protein
LLLSDDVKSASTFNVVIDNNNINDINNSSDVAGIYVDANEGTNNNFILSIDITQNTVTNLGAGCIVVDQGPGGGTVNLHEASNSCTVTKTGTITTSGSPTVPSSSQLASLGDFVWNDLNGDGDQDGGEPGVAGVSINAVGSGINQTVFTDADGYYFFPALPKQNYTLTITVPAAFAGLTGKDIPGNDALDSDFDQTTKTVAVALTVSRTNVDAGLTESSCPTISFTATPTSTCSGTSNGQIAVSGVSGGTGPYMYSKDNGANYQSGATFTGLAATTYQVVVKDANGCTSGATAIAVGAYPPPSCSITGSNTICNNQTGIYTAPEGMSAYNWEILFGAGGNIIGPSNEASVSAKPAGQSFFLKLTITDANGCTSACVKTVFQLEHYFTTAINVTPNPVCFGVMLDLSASVSASSTVSWSGSGISNAMSNPTTALPTASGSQIYSVTESTPDGCFNTVSTNVMVNPLPTASISGTLSFCTGSSTTLTASGGGSYLWDDASTNAMRNITAGGTYTVQVTDNNGCTDTQTATVTENSLPTMICPSYAPVCAGSAAFALTGGSPGGGSYSGPGVSAGMFDPVIAGVSTHMITYDYTDGNGCSNSCTFNIVVEVCCMVTADAGSDKEICPGKSVSIGGAPTGSGTPTLSYSWSPAAGLSSTTDPNPTASPASTTIYTVTVTSTAGCNSTSSVTVTVYDAVTASATPTDALCNGLKGKITMTMGGGTGPYDLNWTGPSSGSSLNKTTGYMIINLPAGDYDITVTDEKGCTKTTSATVGEPNKLTASGTPTDVSCSGNADGKITMNISGGTSPYDIAWDGPGGNDGTANNKVSGFMIPNLPAGNYDLTITDDHGCVTTTSTAVGTANQLPVCSISDAMGVVCPNSAGNKYSAPAGMDTYVWSITGNGSIPGSKAGPMVEVTAGASGTYTVSVVITKNGCSSDCSKEVDISMIPFQIVSTAQFCMDDPGPSIGLDGSEVGAMYQLQTSGGANVGAPVAGSGTAISFGSHPNGNYKVVITGGTCNGTLTATVNGTATACAIAVPDVCGCDDPSGYSGITIKITAPALQTWTVVEVIGLYGPANPFPQLTPGTPLTYIGGGMYTLAASRKNNKGFYVKVSNGYTEKEIQVSNPSW